jgi:triphosphoribosyl-dephospho-CoA synthetase
MLEQIFTLPITIITALGVVAYVLNGRREKDIAYIKAREQFERELNALRRLERFRKGLNATIDRKEKNNEKNNKKD